MWSCYILVVVLIFQNCFSSEFIVDREDCLLSSKNHSLIIDLYSSYATHEAANYTVYFSLCPKRLKKCPRDSFICLVDKDGQSLDLGSTIAGISFEGTYNIALKSKNGNGNVLIMCHHENGEMPPLFDNEPHRKNASQPYSYSINWISSTSCPLRHYKTKNNCILYTKEQSYDLRPLQHSTDLHTKHGSETYYINFCKDVCHKDFSKSSVCIIRNGKPYSIAYTEDSTLQHIESRGLTLSYKNLDGRITVISFVCSLNSTKPRLELIEEDEGEILFKATTSLICPQNKMNCLIHHQSRVYDISTLYHLKDNWHLDLKDGRKLIFNICGPLNYVPYLLCSGGPYFACLFDDSNNSLALAYDTKEKVLRPGLISLEISGMSNNNSVFFLNITLECAKNSTYPFLVNNGIVGNNYSVYWRTDAACPSEISKAENDCKLKNVYYNTLIDLSPLHKNNGDYSIIAHDESFRINVCGSLNQSCSQTRDASVCYKNKQGKEFAIGLIGSKEPMFKDGQFVFHLEGEPCNEKVTKSKVKIILSSECFEEGSATTVQPNPEYFPRANECEFYFFWKTSLLCTERASTNCSLQERNKTYDLSPLKNLKDNYFVPYNNSVQIVLNVCHSLLPGHRIGCHSLAGSCLVDDDIDSILSDNHMARKQYKNLGLVSATGHLEYVNGTIHLIYTNGAVCESGLESSSKTIVKFECNETANGTEPVLVSSNDCEYIFKWTTLFACPISPSGASMPLSVSENKTVNIKRCSVNTKKKRYDLSTLMRRDWQVENKNIILGVCRPVRTHICPRNSGACLMTEERGVESIGDFNTNVIYEDDSLFLYYNTSSYKQTKIKFICSKHDLMPRFIEERETVEGFITFITWPISEVCDKEVEKSCCHQIEHLCGKYDSSYMVSLNEVNSVFLSLCQPVIPEEGLLCPGSSASCIVSKLNNSFVNEKSLGKVVQQPIFNKDKSIIVEYLNGDSCTNDVKYSTSIRFHCSHNKTDNHPKFVRVVDGCRYEFDWGSNLLCSEPFNQSIPITDNTIPDRSVMVIDGTLGDYIINFCKPSTKCGSQVCKYVPGNKWLPFAGNINKTESHDSAISYFFSPTNKNDFGKCGAVAKFIKDIVFEDPVIKEETECYIEIVVRGNISCPEVIKNVNEDNRAASTWYVIPIMLSVIALVLVIGILYMKNKRQNLMETVQYFFRYRRGAETDMLQL